MDEWARDALQGRIREVPIAPARLALLATSRCDEVVAELTQRIRAWCREGGLAPHNSIDIAASIALAMAASGMALGPSFNEELTRRAKAHDTPDGLLGLAEAADQVGRYLSAAAPPLGP